MSTSNRQDKKEEEKESKEDTRAKAHKKAEENAKKLQESVASLIYQAETEMRERAIQKEEQRLKMAAPKSQVAIKAGEAAQAAEKKAKTVLGRELKEGKEGEEQEKDVKLLRDTAVQKREEATKAATEVAKQKALLEQEEKEEKVSLEQKQVTNPKQVTNAKKEKIKETEEIAQTQEHIARAAESAVIAKEAAMKAEKIAQLLELEAKAAREGAAEKSKADTARAAAEEAEKAAKEAETAAKAAAQDYNEEPPLIHPLTAYGYGAPGGEEFKKLIDKLQIAVNDFAHDIARDEEKAAEEKEAKERKNDDSPGSSSEKKHQQQEQKPGVLGVDYEKKYQKSQAKKEAKVESKAAVEFKKSFNDFEKLVRDTQNGWMLGQPVEPDVLKAEAKKLQTELAKYESTELKDSGKLQKIKDQLTDFPANIDKAVENWQRKAQERVHSNASIRVHHGMLAAEIKAAHELKRELGSCDILRMTAADIQVLQDDKSPDHKMLDSLPLNKEPDSTRAYVLIENEIKGEAEFKKVVYINKTTKEITEIELTEEQSKELEKKFKEIRTTAGLYSKKEGFGWRSPLKVPTVVSKLGDNPENSARMEPYHEKWIASIIGLKPDWKNTLPCAYGDAKEREQRVLDEKECLELCYGNKEQAAKMACDKAMERLEKFKDKDMEYDVGGDKFRVHRKKDEDGHLVFSVAYMGDKGRYLHGTNPAAMASMVDVCYKQDPLNPVELGCESLTGQPIRVLKKVELQLEHAIKHAEDLAKKGVYIGIEIDANALAVLSALSNKDLKTRAENLFLRWKEETAQTHQNMQQVAIQRYAAESKVAALLATTPPGQDEKQVEDQLSPLATALHTELKSQGDSPIAADERFDEVKGEAQKLDWNIKNLHTASQAAKGQMEALQKELDNPKVMDRPTKLQEIIEQLEALTRTQETLAQESKKMAEKALNYTSWIADSRVATIVFGVDREAEKPVILPDKKEADVRKESPESFRAFDKRAEYEKLQALTEQAGVTVNKVSGECETIKPKIDALKEKAKSYQAALEQKRLEPEPEPSRLGSRPGVK